MIVVDVALQAFRDLRGSGQAKLKPGYNGVVCASLNPESLAHGILETLYGPAARSHGSAEPRGVLTVRGSGESVLRVVRDLSRGGLQTFGLDAATGAFIQTGGDPAELARALLLPSRDTFATAFLLMQSDLPSANLAADTALTAPLQAGEHEVAERRLAQLEAVLGERDRVRELEYELDGLQKRKFEIEDTFKARAIDPEHVRAAEAALARLSYFDQIPDDFAQTYEAALAKEAHRAADLVRWGHEREELERLMRAATVEPVLRDWRLWAGLAVGAAAVATGTLLGGLYRYATFVNIPALGLTALALWQNLTLREELSVAKRRLEMSDRRRERIEARDKDEIHGAKQLAASANMSSIEEIKRMLGERQSARTRLEELHRSLEAARTDPELMRLREEQGAIQARIDRIEHDLSSFTSSGSDIMAMEAEARTLRTRLGRAAPAAPPPSSAPFDALLGAAVELLGASREDCAATLTQRGTQFVSHLSSKRISRLEIDVDGNVNVVLNGKPASIGGLQPTAQDLAYLAVRGALLTAVDPGRRMPLIVTPLTSSAPSWANLVRAYLNVLAQAGLQVLQLAASAEECAGVPSVARFEVAA